MRGSTGYAAAEDRSLANDVNTNEVTSTGGTRGERKPTERDSRNKQATGDKEVERYAVLTRASSFFLSSSSIFRVSRRLFRRCAKLRYTIETLTRVRHGVLTNSR